MLITINTDGSYFPETGQAGFAFWISSDKGRFCRYGKLKDAKNALEAELQSLANALHFCRTHPDLKECKKIIINCDCLNLKSIIEKPNALRKNKQKRLRQLRGKLQEYIGKFRGCKCEYEFRWCPAHKKVTDARTYVNRQLDKAAKKGAKL